MIRRANGEGGLHWDERRQRWMATVTFGYDGRGKRVVRKAAGQAKTEAKAKLRELLRNREDGLSASSCTVHQAVADWLTYGLGLQGSSTFGQVPSSVHQAHSTRCSASASCETSSSRSLRCSSVMAESMSGL